MAAPVGNTNRATQYRLQREIEAILRGESASDALEELRLLIRAQVNKAKEGDTQAFKEIMDRWAGKAVATTELSGPEGGPVPVQAIDWNIVPPKA